MNGLILSPFFSLCDFPTFSPPLPLKKTFSPSSFTPNPYIVYVFIYICLPSALLFGVPLYSLPSPFSFFLAFIFLHSHTQFPSFLHFLSQLFELLGGCNNGLHSDSVSMVMGGPRVLCAIQTCTGDSVFLHMTHNKSLFLLPTFLLDL